MSPLGLFDTHAHLDRALLAGDLAALLARAATAGVTHILAVGGSPAANTAALDACARFPDRLAAAIGYDRDQATERLPDLPPALPPSVRAIGEIGLDYHYHAESARAQRALCAAQLAWARTLRLPVVVHSREADADTLALLEEHAAAWPGAPARLGVLHCFTRGAAFAERVLALGFHLSFSGILTFRNADSLRAIARDVPLERLLIETDTPYLAPEPRRGHANEPAYLPHTLDCLADVRQVAPEALGLELAANARRLFAWPPDAAGAPAMQ